ncbi:serine hydrolase domain-containing protein [Actinomarinicola tropica]|uniref:Serine hydrolase n=1 Tax=Actinomarinicola tropica TaxID=2789776 RepID=A0A5Q2RGQ3_9ACTN|nr:serine hydrolase [Actinomarinicola tropica]QGG94814.1 serine hydrolase [Actinomarinicola tropica]
MRCGATTDMPSVRRSIVAVVLALTLVVAGCSDDGGGDDVGGSGDAAPETTTSTAAETTTTTVDERPWPTDEWPTTTPADAGLEQADLDRLAAQAEAGSSHCLAVTRDGELVAEWYWAGTDETTERESWSVTKSVTATLVGIAQDDGALDIDQPASDFITEWQGTPSEDVTIRQLLANDSGRYYDAATDYGAMAVQAEDKTAFSIALEQQHDPGTHWDYNNSAIQTLEAVLERATGEDVVEFADERLFAPLGMESELTTDAAGNALVFMGMQTTCRDLARFGLLYLRGGEWQGEQILSEAFVSEAVQPSQSLNPTYGFLWWLLGDVDASTAPGQGDVSGGGAEGYAALGLGNQVLAVFPDTGLVVTRLGPQGGDFGAAQIGDWAATVD